MDNKDIISSSRPNDPLSTGSLAVQNESPGQDGTIRRASLLNWLPRLFFRPGKFFAENARSTPTFVVAFCVFVFGAAWSLTYYIDSRQSPEMTDSLALARLYGNAFGLAVLGGTIWYVLWGAWYGLRLSFCKPQGMSWKLARRVFIFSALVYSLPCGIGMFIWWIIQDQYFLLVALIVSTLCIFWSVYVSYRGVRTVFQAARFRAVLLFLVLPCIFYGACVAVPIFLSKARSPSTDTSSWKEFTSPGGEFKVILPIYPQHEMKTLQIPDSQLTIEYDSYTSETVNVELYSVTICTYPLEIDTSNPDDLLEYTIDGMLSIQGNRLISSDLTYFGRFRALDFSVQSNDVFLKGKLIIVESTIYQLMVACDNKIYSESNYNKFINSFVLR